MKNILKMVMAFLLVCNSIIGSAQSRRAPEIRSCLASEIAFSAMENANPNKGWDDNFEIGKKLGYVISEYYQKAIWAMDRPEVEGREVVISALQSAQQRIKYMEKDTLKRDVERCRASFN